MNATAETLNKLKNASDAEIEIAKGWLKAKLRRKFTSAPTRLLFNSKMQHYAKQPGDNYADIIDQISPADVRAAVSAAVKSPLTLVVNGGQVHKIPSIDRVSQLFN